MRTVDTCGVVSLLVHSRAALSNTALYNDTFRWTLLITAMKVQVCRFPPENTDQNEF